MTIWWSVLEELAILAIWQCAGHLHTQTVELQGFCEIGNTREPDLPSRRWLRNVAETMGVAMGRRNDAEDPDRSVHLTRFRGEKCHRRKENLDRDNQISQDSVPLRVNIFSFSKGVGRSQLMMRISGDASNDGGSYRRPEPRGSPLRACWHKSDDRVNNVMYRTVVERTGQTCRA